MARRFQARATRLILFGIGIVALLGLTPAPVSAADNARPTTPTELRGSTPAGGTVSLTWAASSDNLGVTGYEVIRNGKLLGTSRSTSYTDTTVRANTDYWYKVQARDAAGNRSQRSEWIKVRATGNGGGAAAAPSQPTGLSGTASAGKNSITWNAPNAPAGIANYRITRSGKIVGTSTNTSWTDTNVIAGKAYWYRVTAVDNNGRSSTISNWILLTGASNAAPPQNPPNNPPPNNPPPNPPAPNGWRMVFNDEFNGSSLDTSKWNYETSNFGHPNGTLHCYQSDSDNVQVANGVLRLIARDQAARCSGTNKNYTSGMVHTKNKVDWTYGRFEVRAKLTLGKGMFPAIWLSPSDKVWGSWPRSGEIDIVEQIGQRPNVMAGSIHWGTPGAPKRNVTEFFSQTRLTDAFHTYAIEWEPGVVRWYIDGFLYATSTTANGWFVPGGGASGAPFNQDFYLIMNLSVGHDWPGAPNASTGLPRDLQIDYVRVYKR